MDERSSLSSSDFELNTDSVQARGLRAWLPECRFDLAGGNYHGTPSGGPVKVPGMQGAAAMQMDGSDDRVDVPDAPVWNGAAATWTAWVNFLALATYETWIAKGTYGTDLSYAFHGSTDGSAGGYLFFTTDGSTMVWGTLPNGTLTANQWLHLAVVYDGVGALNADRLKFYLDARLITLASFSGTIPTTLFDSATPLRLGEMTGVAGRNLGGRIRDVRLYDRALSARTIAAMAAPQTRFELWRPRGRSGLAVPATAAVATPAVSRVLFGARPLGSKVKGKRQGAEKKRKDRDKDKDIDLVVALMLLDD